MASDDEESRSGLHRVLLNRYAELEASHVSLQAQFGRVVQIKNDDDDDDGAMASSSGQMTVTLPGKFRGGSPYSHVLQSINHAVHVTQPSTGEIIYWNRAAEKLYGWKDSEAVGRSFWDLLIDDEHAPYINNIREKLQFGESWSGQFPHKKRSGEIFVALVTESPLYEDDELVGVITVSSDAAVYNSINSSQRKGTQNNMKRIQWQQRPQIALVPQMTSSITDLASKVLGRIRNDDCLRDEEGFVSECEDGHRESRETYIAKNSGDGKSSHTGESVIAQPAKMAAKLLARFRRKSFDNNGEVTDSSPIQNGFMRKADDVPSYSRGSKETTFNSANDVRQFHLPGKIAHMNENSFQVNDKDAKQLEAKKSPNSGENLSGSSSSSSGKGDGDSNSVVDSDIQWEDLRLGEEIGKGSFAVVYHGLWNGSDVAIKVYFDKEYNEGTLSSYKKEIGIMRKLRHPNVLLFMGACYSEERLAIVTEFLPRGSLFKILHRSNQVLELMRRLRMALDVARGMNYLHHRNPPIVHRDLKSSNLLVDKKWNVKVGDFGLSKLKNATYLTAKSGGGTPQWMAPEVLRNDPCNEKSDVFSFGVILWELMTLKIPWDSLNALQVVAVVGFMDRRLDLPDNGDPRISSIIEDCWQSKPELRPSFENIIQRMTGILKSIPPTAATAPVQKRLTS